MAHKVEVILYMVFIQIKIYMIIRIVQDVRTTRFPEGFFDKVVFSYKKKFFLLLGFCGNRTLISSKNPLIKNMYFLQDF